MDENMKKRKNKHGYDFESYYDGIPPEIKKMSMEEIDEAIKKEIELEKQLNKEK